MSTLPLASPELVEGAGEGRIAGLGRRVRHRLARHLARAPFAMRNDAPILSITFDDAPDSALVGARMLEEAGAAGTFYVASGLLGRRTRHWRVMDADGVRRLHAAGHEIAGHTFSHVRVPDVGLADLAADLDRDAARLGAIVPGLRPTNFAYPYGFATAGAKGLLASRFATSRGIAPRLNAGRIDLQMVSAFPLVDAQMGPAAIDRMLDDALRLNGWAVFYGHDVADAPSPYGCTPGLLAHVIEAARRRGIALATVARAVALIGRD